MDTSPADVPSTTAVVMPVAKPPGNAMKRGTLVAMILASGVVFLDGSVVNVALPAIGRDLRVGLSGLQWIVDGYALTLAALLIVGGSLGDHYGRKRLLTIGLIGFGVASVACGLAPSSAALIVARMAQGVAGALLVPEGLAIISAVFDDDAERGQAIGAWTAWGGVLAVLGPFLGGGLVDHTTWRWVFFINVPLILVTLLLVARFVPETRDTQAPKRLDFLGATLIILGLGGISYGLIEGPNSGWASPAILAALIGGAVALALFVVAEARVRSPMVPLALFKVRNFSGANLATLGVYAALAGAAFLIVIYVQNVLRYSALAAGATLLPLSAMMLLFASRFGKLSGRYGPRRFMAIGPLLMGIAFLLALRLAPGASYWTALFPAAVLLGAGLCVTVAPLTSTVMGSVASHNGGIASAINNVAARVAGLLAVAGLGVVVSLAFTTGLDNRARGLPPQSASIVREAARAGSGIAPPGAPPEVIAAIADAYTTAFHRAMLACALLAFASGLAALALIRDPPRATHETTTN
ncbi:MAG: DHA2 family efflux MFS transporter permease subunit [Thermomicrobiales bacterium]